MIGKSARGASLRHKAVEELKEFLLLAVYLYICLGALIFLKSAILEAAGISYTAWGVAAVKALILAKFMLLGRAFHLGELHRDLPLIWPILFRSATFLILLLILTTIEELLVGFFHSRPLADSIAHIAGPTLMQVLATLLFMFLVLLPYFAFSCLREVLGDRYVIRLFFVERPAGIPVQGSV